MLIEFCSAKSRYLLHMFDDPSVRFQGSEFVHSELDSKSLNLGVDASLRVSEGERANVSIAEQHRLRHSTNTLIHPSLACK